MAKYLTSLPSAGMVVPEDEWEAVGRDAHAVIGEAKAAGVYVFGGGIDESVAPALVSAERRSPRGELPLGPALDGGFTVLELPSREGGRRVGGANREGLSLRPGTARVGFGPES